MGVVGGIKGLATAVARPRWRASPRVREVFSGSREHFVRVLPGESLGDTLGFAGEKKGKYATAEFYRRAKNRSYQLVAETALLFEETVTCVVQVAGKVRERLEVPVTIGDDQLRERALASDGVRRTLDGRSVRTVIVRAPRLVNVVPA